VDEENRAPSAGPRRATCRRRRGAEEIEFTCRTGATRSSRCAASDGGHHSTGWIASASSATNLAATSARGSPLTISEIARAERKRAEIWHRWRALFEQYDALLTPTAPVPPFPVEKNYPEVVEGRRNAALHRLDRPTFLVSLAALPAASVPAGSPPRAAGRACRSSARVFGADDPHGREVRRRGAPIGLPPTSA